MIKGRVKVINRLGLHARAAALVVKKAAEFESKITLIREEKSIYADAKSILSVLTLAAAQGMELMLEVDGSDENAAFEAISSLFETGFGEV
ncbi:MAG: HPr family phosphocarrier protein [Acidobacteria bacterium]|nr:MAG: HPr family phosphocarrier protein [Acidobacteriota bacterium]REK01394.1 MAG: HPr family phosphocarrier protein [Acidobacteriota bacterium]REK14350.1 MAG: HPr family phosphocarrier protein [Acidobacteriota bacterium]REK45065.1 MAG: HPr family phosphocarrier protein [Acidobacteriota bacterium]